MILVQILCEFVENSFEHGYRSTAAGPIDVEATLDGHGMVHASVSDRGQWKAPSADPGMRGRGLMLADALATESRIVGSDSGTTASITHRLCRPARIVIDPNVVPVTERPAAQSSLPRSSTIAWWSQEMSTTRRHRLWRRRSHAKAAPALTL